MVAPGRDWINWCRNAGFFPRRYYYQYAIEYIDATRVMILEDLEDLNVFATSFGCVNRINWKKVAQDYAGVYFKRDKLYQHALLDQCGMDSLIYSLDVNSMVVWNLEIMKLKLKAYCADSFNE